MTLTEEFIKKSCSPTIYKRGIEYFKQGRVFLKDRPDDVITAQVDDEKQYTVQVKLGERDIEFMFCSCMYFETMHAPCKHIAATMLQRLSVMAKEPTPSENNSLCEQVWSSYITDTTSVKLLPIHFELSINSATPRDYSYFVDLQINGRELSSPIEFFSARSRGECFDLSKRQKNISVHAFAPNEERILDVLTEIYENNIATNEIVTISSHMYFGAAAAKRIFKELANTDYSITLNRVDLAAMPIVEADPDVMIDISAEGSQIQVYVNNVGTALTPDGSVFLHEKMIHLTSLEWRNAYMPLYKALAVDNRTQLTFSGDNALGFATYALPKLSKLSGTSTTNLSGMVISAKPEFTAYLDNRDGVITCAIKVNYGGISIMLPNGSIDNDAKIVVRDFESEAEVLDILSSFTYEDDLYRLSDDEAIFDFLSTGINKLSKLAKLLTTTSFTTGGIKSSVSLSGSVSYDEKIDLLEADINVEFTPKELKAIFAAVKERKPFYRMKDGSFIDLEKDHHEIAMLKWLNMSEAKQGENGLHVKLPKAQLFYLANMSPENIELTEKAREYVDNLKTLKATIPTELDGILRGYQKEGMNWMKQLTYVGLGGILADSMGLGKTIQMLAFMHSEYKDRASLIITPSSLTYNWLAEIDRFLPGVKTLIVDGTQPEREDKIKTIDEYEFVITSYPLIRRDAELYLSYNFAFCVIDEAQNIKNSKTANAQSVMEINADFKFALTGTPIENSLTELWSVLNFANKGYLGSKTDFKIWYENPIMRGSSDAMVELKSKIKPFVLRRLKQDVLRELPDRQETTIVAEMTEEQAELYAAYRQMAREKTSALLSGNEKDAQVQILTMLLRLRQICCHPSLYNEKYKGESGKLNLLRNIVETGISSGHRILIFSQFTAMLDIIKGLLDKMEVDYFYLDGKTPSRERLDMADKFNAGEGEVFLISLKAGGTGLNLVGADMVIHYDPWWNPAVTDQASDRAHRIGQTKNVQIYRLASRHSIEEKILLLQEKKRALADDVITANSTTLSSMTHEEILSLFE